MPQSATMYEELNPSLCLCSCKNPSDRGGTGPPAAYLNEPTLNIRSAVLNRKHTRKHILFLARFLKNIYQYLQDISHICELYLASNVSETLCEARQVYCSYAARHPEPTTWLADHLQLGAMSYWQNGPHVIVRHIIKAAWREGIHFFEVKLWNTWEWDTFKGPSLSF